MLFETLLYLTLKFLLVLHSKKIKKKRNCVQLIAKNYSTKCYLIYDLKYFTFFRKF